MKLSKKSDVVVKYYRVQKGLKVVEEAEKNLEAEKNKNKNKEEEERQLKLEAELERARQELQSKMEKLQTDHPNWTAECAKNHTLQGKLDTWGEYAKNGLLGCAVGGVLGSMLGGAVTSSSGMLVGAACGGVVGVAALPLFVIAGTAFGTWKYFERRQST